MTWTSQRLSGQHDLSQFDCGVDSLNRWLTEQAYRAAVGDYARTTVWTEPESPVVRAYYAVSPTQVLRDEVGRGASGGYTKIPAYLLARLALDTSLHGQGLGSQLLLDALEMIVVAAIHSAGRLIMVDAIDDGAAAFYRRHDFTPVHDNPRRLFMKVATARAALGIEDLRVVPSGEVPLAAATLTRSDGSRTHMIVDSDDLHRLARHIEQAAERGAPVRLADVIQEALGDR